MENSLCRHRSCRRRRNPAVFHVLYCDCTDHSDTVFDDVVKGSLAFGFVSSRRIIIYSFLIIIMVLHVYVLLFGRPSVM